MNNTATPEFQGNTHTLSTPSAHSDALHSVACCAVDAIRAIAQHLDPGSPDYALCLNLEFIAGGLDRAADAFESADMDARKATEGAA